MARATSRGQARSRHVQGVKLGATVGAMFKFKDSGIVRVLIKFASQPTEIIRSQRSNLISTIVRNVVAAMKIDRRNSP